MRQLDKALAVADLWFYHIVLNNLSYDKYLAWISRVDYSDIFVGNILTVDAVV